MKTLAAESELARHKAALAKCVEAMEKYDYGTWNVDDQFVAALTEAKRLLDETS